MRKLLAKAPVEQSVMGVGESAVAHEVETRVENRDEDELLVRAARTDLSDGTEVIVSRAGSFDEPD